MECLLRSYFTHSSHFEHSSSFKKFYLTTKQKLPPFLTDDAHCSIYKSNRMFLQSNKQPGGVFLEGFDSLLTKLGITNHFVNDPKLAREVRFQVVLQ